jgi:hypothetical protein
MFNLRQSLSLPHARTTLAIAAAATLFVSGAVQPQQPPPPSNLPLPKADPAPQRIITQGLAKTVTEDLIPCGVTRPGMNLRKNPVGEITAKDGTMFTVPTANNFLTTPKLPDLYNECSGVTPKDLSEVDLNKVSVLEIDKDGEVVTGFMVADNYFELYINGKLIGVDATPFTPFNSHVVRFRVKRPYTIAVLAAGLGRQAGPRDGGIPGEHLAFRRRRVCCEVLRWHGDEQHVEGAVILHRASPAPRRCRRVWQHPRHLPPRWAHPPAGEAADLQRTLLRDPLSDSGRMDESEFRRLQVAAGFRVSRSRSGHHGGAGILALPRGIHRGALDLDDQSGLRQHGPAAQDRAIG